MLLHLMGKHRPADWRYYEHYLIFAYIYSCQRQNGNRTVLVHRKYEAWKKSTSFNERQSFSELRFICTIAGEWAKPTWQPCSFILIQWNQSCKVETMVLKWVITKDQILNTDVYKLGNCSVQYLCQLLLYLFCLTLFKWNHTFLPLFGEHKCL